MNKKSAFYLILLVITVLTALLFFSPDVAVYATDGAVNMGNVLDYLLNPKQITAIDALSQWHQDFPRREIITTIPEGEEPFSKAQLPIQAATEVDGTPVADEYIYYILQLDGDDAFGMSNEGESRPYWNVDDTLYFGPIEEAMNYAPVDINKIAPSIIAAAGGVYETSQVNLYALVALESSITADSLYYQEISDPMSFDVLVRDKGEVDIDGNLLPDNLFALVTAGTAWFDSDGIRNVVAASLDFPDTPLAPGQAANTVRLLPDDPDYNVIVELPTTNALGVGGTVLGVVQTARNFMDLFDDVLPSDVLAALNKAPGDWLEGMGGEIIGIGIVVLHDDGTKAVLPINTLSVPGRIEIGNVNFAPIPGDVRVLGLWRYPLEITNDGTEDYFSLPATGQWMPVAMQANYDGINQILTAEISGGGAIMPMLVATELRLDSVTPVTAEICAETPLVIAGSIPVWMGADPVSGLTAAEADARYEVVLVNGGDEGTLVFREVGGYAVSGLNVNSENEAYLIVPDTWNFAGMASIEFRDKDDAANSVTLVDAIDFSDGPPVITLLGISPVAHECGTVYTDAGATALDACDDDLTASIITGGDVVDVQTPGAYVITYNVSDSASNAAAEVTRTVNVTDTTVPVITLAGVDPVTVECGGAYVDAGATALDACDGDLTGSIVVGGDTVDTAVSGTYVISYNVADASMNAAVQVTRTVHVTDTTPPVLTLLGSDPVTLECGSPYTDAGATALDNCGGDLTGSIVIGSAAVDTGTAGTYVVTYNVSDGAANAAVEITRTVNVVDTTPPVLTRIGDATITVECGDTFTDPGFTASDLCEGILPVVVGGDTVDTAVVDVYVITYNVSDGQGNAAPQRTRTVAVVDTTNPVVTIIGDNPVTLECGTAYVDAGATATDTCDGDLTGAIVVSNAVNTSVAGNYLVTYTVTDTENNETVEFRTVDVVDTTAPVMTLVGDPVINLECGIGYTEPGATASDDCDGDLTAAMVIAGDVVNTNVPGTYTVTYNVTDGAGLPAAEVQRTVNVADTTLPVITLNGNAIEIVECGSIYNEQGATATDSCSGNLTASIVIGGASVDTGTVGDYIITYNVSDGAANAAVEVTRTVSVVDNTAPVITLVGEPDIIVDLAGTYTDQGATAADACDGDLTANIVPGGDPVNVNAVGVYVVTYNVVDGQGNNADEVVRNVYVVDGTSPYLENVTVLGPNVVQVVFSETMGAGVLDEANYVISGTGRGTLPANPVSIAAESGTTYRLSWDCPASMFSGGNITITVSPTIQDSNSNTLVPPLSVTDVGGADAQLPQIIVGGVNPVSVECGSSYSDVGATALDRCFTDISASIVAVNPVDVNTVGTYFVTYNVTDGAGNAALQATRTVNVVDTADPVISLTGNDPEFVECGGAYADAGATAYDNCEGDISSLVSVGGDVVNTETVGAYVIAYDVTDNGGNAAATVTRTVYVEDVTPPIITLLGNNPVTVECGAAYADAGATASDVCDGNVSAKIAVAGDSVDTGTTGVYTITYNVSDNATNAATEVTRVVNVVDSGVPFIALLGANPLTLECGAAYSEPGATASDSCKGDISGDVIVGGDVIDANTTGSYAVTYNVSDGNGNSAVEVVRTVNVADTDPPLITLIGNALVTMECNTPYSDAGATAVDVCEGVLTGAIATVNPVNTAVTGTYTVTYNVADSALNNAMEVIRTVDVVDTAAPIISLNGDAIVAVECGDAYVDAGADALDGCDGDLTAGIAVVSTVNTTATGTYIVTYNVSDSEGNAATEVMRTVNVEDTVSPVITLLGEAEVVVPVNDPYADAGAIADDDCDGDLSGSIVVAGDTVDTATVGTYVITYDVTDTASNAAIQVIRTVNVVDTVNPFVSSVTVLSTTEIQVVFSKDMGAGVLDPANYTVSGAGRGTLSPNPDSVSGAGDTYVLAWSCPEIMRNGGSITVTVHSAVQDAVGNTLAEPRSRTHIGGGIASLPVITLAGSSVVTIECGDAYADAGATAADQCGTDLTASIVVNNAVAASAVGSYTVTYNVVDAAGNAAVQIMRTVNVEDTTAPVITLQGDAVTSVECSAVYTDAGATALDVCDGDLTVAILVNNPVDTALVGAYSVTYNVTDGEGNAAIQVVRTVNVVDTVPPVISLVGNANVQVECGAAYTDAGATALDACDGNLTSGIIVNNPVDTAVVGIYSVTYNVNDAASNAAAQVTRTVAVTDITLPVITLLGDASVTVECGAGYVDAGATAADNCDGDLTASMVVDNPVNAGIPGNYTIRYNVTDNEGNNAVEATRAVVVEDTVAPVITLVGDSEVEIPLGGSYVEDGALAVDDCDGNLSASITIAGDTVNTSAVGTHVVTYNVADAVGNNATQVIRTVYVVDATKPYLLSVSVASVGSVEVVFSKDMGAGVDVPGNYLVSGSGLGALSDVPDSVTGIGNTWLLTWSGCPIMKAGGDITVMVAGIVEDSLGNTMGAPFARTDFGGAQASLPVITLNGTSPISVECAAVYTDAGAAATDQCSTDITTAISSINTVDVQAVGSYLVTYNVVDSAGNNAVPVTREVNVVDTTPPVITRNGQSVIVAECGSVFVDPGVTATDACEGNLTGSVVTSGDTVNTSVAGTYVIRYDVSDSNANAAAQRTRTVVVSDNTPPVISLIGNATVTVECGTGYVDAGATAHDVCEGDLTGAIAVFNPVNTSVPGSYFVRYTVADSQENTAVEVVRTVNIIDTVAPIITLTGSSFMQIECGSPYVELGATVLDVCDGDITGNLIIDSSNVDTGNTGTYSVTYSASDAALNNAVQKVRTVTVIDTTAPVITLIGDPAVSVECGETYLDAGAAALDACDGDLTSSIFVGGVVDEFVLGAYVLTYNVSDNAMNAATEVVRTVTVDDTQPPDIKLAGDDPVAVECSSGVYNESGFTSVIDLCDGDMFLDMPETVTVYFWFNAELIYEAILLYGEEGEGMVSGIEDIFNVYGDAGFDAEIDERTPFNKQTGEYVIQYVLEDALGNEDLAERTIEVIDTVAPVIMVEGPVNIECGGMYGQEAIALDDCDGISVTYSIIEGGDTVDTGIPGTYVVTFNVSDSSANAAEEVLHTVTVSDTNAPVLSLVGDAAVTIECGGAYTELSAAATDVCDGNLDGSIVVGGDAVDTGLSGVYIITYNVSDSSGNAATEVIRTVIIEDTTAPEISLVGDAAVTLECGGVYTELGVTATDACDGDLTSGVIVGGAVDTAVPGEYTLTYNLSDSAANAAAEVTRTVTVVDTTPPAISLVGDAAVTVECSSTYTDAGATATDACDGDLTSGVIVGGAVDTAVPGEYTLTYNVSDSAANAATEVTRTVMVDDTTDPALTLVGDAAVTVECGDVYVDAGATALDVCDGDLTASIIQAGDAVYTSIVGTYTLTYNVSDSSDNAAAEITRTITIADTLAPVIMLNGAAELSVDCNGVYTEQGATAADTCDGILTDSIVIGGDTVDTSVPGEYVITYNVSDSSSNAADQVVRTVTVLDNCNVDPCDPDLVAPVIILNGEPVFTVECKGVYTEPGATATDNCDVNLSANIAVGGDAVNVNVVGSYTVTYTVSDTAGNNASQITRTVIVEDTTPPELALLGSETVRVECKGVYTDAGAMAFDDCEGNLTNAIVVDNPVDTNTVGIYTITYTVSDSSGNAAVPLMRTVRVMDTIAPVMNIGELNSTLVYDADGFLVLEAGTPFADLESPEFIATDTCAGSLGLPQSVVEADTPGVLTWAWALDADGKPRWFNDAGTIRPVAYAYDEFTAEVGNHLLVYVALDGNGNSYPTVDEEGIPGFFDDEDNLDIFDTEGNLKVDYVRLVKIEDTTAPEISLVGGARIAVDCGVEFVDPGFAVADNASGDIEVTYSGDPNVNVPGNYVRTYFAVDSAGNEQTLDRLISVRDNCPILNYTLDVDVIGDGAVAVSPDQETYEAGSTVTLTASPAYKSRFVNWSGDAAGNELAVTVVMDSDKTVLANFNPIVWLTAIVTPNNGGTLAFAPEPLELARGDEVGAWVATYDTGAIVAVTVQPADRYKFRGWEGDIDEPEGGRCKIGCRRDLETTITVELDRDKTVEAVFKRKLPWWVYVLIGIGLAGAIAAVAGG
jgi:large repetitive protein